jgi:arsenate reductase-like glutaredoxin family protein
VRAREFLAQELGDKEFVLRNLIKEKLTADEIRALAKKVGDVKELVAPKRRAEAEGLDGDKLVAWLAADGSRLRRPIIAAPKKVTLGFSKDTAAALKGAW